MLLAQIEGNELEIEELKHDLDTARTRINNLITEGSAFEARLAAATVSGASTHRTKSEKIPDPPKFSGDRKDLDRFKADVIVKVTDNADRYATEEAKINYLFSLCDGDAKRALLPLWADANVIRPFTTVVGFLEYLDIRFGDADRAATAQANIDRLRQKNRDFVAYYTEFSRDIEATGYNEAARKAALLRGLSDELMNAMVLVDIKSLTLSELVATATRVDSRLRTNVRNQQANRNKDGTFRGPPGAPRVNLNTPASATTVTTTTTQGGDSMDLSAGAANVNRNRVGRGALTDAEKLDRRAKGLCLYCGVAGHMVRDCPKKPRLALRAATVADAEGNNAEQGNATTQ